MIYYKIHKMNRMNNYNNKYKINNKRLNSNYFK